MDYSTMVPRAPFDVSAALDIVAPVCQDVAAHGVEALRQLSAKFDHVVPRHFRVPAEALEQALDGLDPLVRQAYEIAIERRRVVAHQELGPEQVDVEVATGAVISQKMIPVNRVGLYVPGGRAPLASSVIHNVVPAQVAGVKQIAVTSPPQADFDGLPHPNILAVCALLGVGEVYAVGGSQAVAMFAYGVDGLCRPVDMICGPGNIYVAAAKRYVQGRVGIDSEAGPTEIAIVADDSAIPSHVAADMVSQAEHDPMAGAVLITDSEALAARVDTVIAAQAAEAKHAERIDEALKGEQSGIVLVRDMEQALAVADAYAAEHLEIHTRDAESLAQRVTNAGAIFIGTWSPVSLGDYLAGSTHVLPTGGGAKHSSGLNVKSFLRAVHLIRYRQGATDAVAKDVIAFAESEDLPSHGNALRVRVEDPDGSRA